MQGYHYVGSYRIKAVTMEGHAYFGLYPNGTIVYRTITMFRRNYIGP